MPCTFRLRGAYTNVALFSVWGAYTNVASLSAPTVPVAPAAASKDHARMVAAGSKAIREAQCHSTQKSTEEKSRHRNPHTRKY